MKLDQPILKAIADNPALSEALQTLFLKHFSISAGQKEIPLGITDENLGQFFRARITGMDVVNKVFAEIARYKTGAEPEKKINEAR